MDVLKFIPCELSKTEIKNMLDERCWERLQNLLLNGYKEEKIYLKTFSSKQEGLEFRGIMAKQFREIETKGERRETSNWRKNVLSKMIVVLSNIVESDTLLRS